MTLNRNSIDSLKGIGIMGIVLVHCGLQTSNDFIGQIVFNGARGVQLMFMINSFLVYSSLSKIQMNKENILRWWIGKFIRLIPLYYFFTGLHLLVFGLGDRYYLGSLSKVSLTNILANYLFLHGFHPYYINSINLNWFIADIALFYFLAPFLYKIINSLEKTLISLFLIVPLVFFLMNQVVIMNVLSVKEIWSDYVCIMSFPAEFPIMLLGILSYFILQRLDFKAEREKMFFSYASLIFGISCLFIMFSKNNTIVFFYNIFSYGITFMIIFCGQLVYPLKIINNYFFQVIGKHSYGIYLSHLFVISFMKKIDLRLVKYGNKYSTVDYLIVLGIAIIISVMSEWMIEKPITKFLNKHIPS